MASVFVSSPSEVVLIDSRTRQGTITLPNTNAIPYRVLNFKDQYGSFSNSTFTVSTQLGESFDDGTTSKTFSNAFSYLTVYALSSKWMVINATQTVSQTISSLNVNQLTFGTGTGWVQFGPVQATVLSSIQLNTQNAFINDLTIGNTSTVNALEYWGLFGSNNNTVLAEISTGAGVQEFLVFKGSSASDRVRVQTTGNFVVETGVSARLWNSNTLQTLSNATPAFIINTSSNVGIQTASPGATLDVAGTGRFVTLSSQQLFVSSVNNSLLLGTNDLTSTVRGLGSIGYVSSLSLVSTTVALQQAGYLSSANLLNLVSTTFLNTSLNSTVAGLGTAGYVSTASLSGLVSTPNLLNLVSTTFLNTSLNSTVVGLGTAGYVSSASLSGLVSTPNLLNLVSTLNLLNLVSTTFLNTSLASTTVGLGTAGYVSSANLLNLVSTGFLNTSLNSTVAGLGTAGYVSSASLLNLVSTGFLNTSLVSTLAGLGTAGYVSSTQLVSTTLGLQQFVSTSIQAIPFVYAGAIVYLNYSVTVGTYKGLQNVLTTAPQQVVPTALAGNTTGNLVAGFQSDFILPANIAGGIWQFVVFCQASGTNVYMYPSLYTRTSGGVETLVASLSAAPQLVPQVLTELVMTMPVPQTTIPSGDVIVVKFFANNAGAPARTVTTYYEDSTYSYVQTTFGVIPAANTAVTSTVQGLGTAGYISSLSLQSTVAGLGTAGYISTSQLTSTVTGLGNIYLSTAGGGGGAVYDYQIASTLKQSDSFSTVAIGLAAGAITQGNVAIAIGQNAGNNTQSASAVAIGDSAGRTTQGLAALAFGGGAGYNNQGNFATAVGNGAGYINQGASALAFGNSAGFTEQATYAVAIGNQAGESNQNSYSVAIGYQAGQQSTLGQYGVAIGAYAGQYSSNNSGTLAVGWYAGYSNQGQTALAIGQESGYLNQGQYTTAIGFQAGYTSQAGNAIAIGTSAGTTNQAGEAVAIGYLAGNNTQLTGAVAIGTSAGRTNQGQYAVSIGNAAGFNGQSNDGIAIGNLAGYSNQQGINVAIGTNAGYDTQGYRATAVGASAASYTQGVGATAIGFSAGNSNQGSLAVAVGYSAGAFTQQSDAVAIGNGAGTTQQSSFAIALGSSAGNFFQADSAVALGTSAGNSNQGTGAVALGPFAGYSAQGNLAIALGPLAGFLNQSTLATAIGYSAGFTDQKERAIAIGTWAGSNNQGADSIAIGSYAGETNLPPSTIVISGLASTLNVAETSAFYVAPIRYIEGQQTHTLGYNSNTAEIGMINSGGGSASIPDFLSTINISASATYVSSLNIVYEADPFNAPNTVLYNVGAFQYIQSKGLVNVTPSGVTAPILANFLNIYQGTLGGNVDVLYNLGGGNSITGTISSPVFYDPNTNAITSFYTSSIYLGDFGGINTGEIATDANLINLYWKGSPFAGQSMSTQNIEATEAFFRSTISTHSLVVYGSTTLTVQGNFVMENGASMNAPLVSTIGATSNGFFVGVGNGSRNLQYSFDGSNWTYGTGQFINTSNARGAHYNGSNLWVAVGDTYYFSFPPECIKYSVDGINWSDSFSYFQTAGNSVWFYNGLWVAAGNDNFGSPGNLKWSTDGINWFNSIIGAFDVQGFAVANDGLGLWVAGGLDTGSNTIKYSLDGSNWNTVIGSFSQSCKGVGFDGVGTWIAVGNDGGGSNIRYSGDGSNWSNVTSGNFGFEGRGVAYGAGLWVAVGNGTGMYGGGSNLKYSGDNGSNWSNCVSGDFSNEAFGVSYSPQLALWIAAGSEFGTNALRYSGDGSNWSNPNTLGGMNFGIGVAAGINVSPSYSVYDRFNIQNAGSITASSIVLSDGTDTSPGNTYMSNARLALFSGDAFKATGPNWATISDQRLKHDIQDANLEICYSNIKELPLRRFAFNKSFIEQAHVYDKHVIGFVAQEVSTIFPKAVRELRGFGFDSLMGLDQDQIHMAMLGTVKKLQDDKERLEARVSTLEAYFTQIR